MLMRVECSVVQWVLLSWCLTISAELRSAEPPGVQLANLEIRESSGIAPSRVIPGAFWTHNDSGDSPRLFAFNESGSEIGQIKVHGARAVDWEDIASGTYAGEPWLWVGDIGDNLARRDEIVIYGFPEPDPRQQNEVDVAKRWRVRFPTGPRDCEALAVDVAQRRILLFDKTMLPTSRVWGIPLDSDTEAVLAIDLGGVNIPWITAADYCERKNEILVGTYLDAFVFACRESSAGTTERLAETLRRPPQVIALPRRRQGEGLCYSLEGDRVALTTEGKPATFWLIPSDASDLDPSDEPEAAVKP